MVILTKEFQSDTSASSELDDLTYEEKRIQIFAKQMLQGRLFMGSFQEKRYVESICAYRDVVSLAKDEHDLIQDILAVKQRIDSVYSGNHWIGITTPDMIGTPASYSIWVELPEATVFGTYWFKIKRIKFNNKETYLRIKIMRPVTQEIYKTSENEEVNFKSASSPHDVFTNIGEEAKEKLLYVFQNITTFKNVKETIMFLFMLLGTLTMSLFELLKFTSEFLLKFMNEFSNFMKSVAPIFQIFANLVDRLFRTLCMLIAFLFKKQPQNQYVYSPNKAYRIPRALPAPSNKHGVIIEEIE